MGWLVAAAALLYIFATPLAELLLIVSGHPNARAAIELAQGMNIEPKPVPTYTPYPTYTPVPPTPTPTPIPPGAALAHIQAEAKAELVVAEHELTERDFHVGVSSGLCSYGGDFTALGRIEAGLDLTDLDGDSVNYDADTQTYTLHLPAPILTKCDVEFIRLTDNSFTLCNPDFDLLRRLGEVQAMTRFTDRALEHGIIAEAGEQAALILEDLVRTFTGKQVKTQYETLRGKPEMDLSCQVSGYDRSYNRVKNMWQKRR